MEQQKLTKEGLLKARKQNDLKCIFLLLPTFAYTLLFGYSIYAKSIPLGALAAGAFACNATLAFKSAAKSEKYTKEIEEIEKQEAIERADQEIGL